GERRIQLVNGSLGYSNGKEVEEVHRPLRFVDQGRGNLRFHTHLGIYRQEDDRLVICLGQRGTGKPPTFFRLGGGPRLLTLHRVNPDKKSPHHNWSQPPLR